jgi:hypothetical protein
MNPRSSIPPTRPSCRLSNLSNDSGVSVLKNPGCKASTHREDDFFFPVIVKPIKFIGNMFIGCNRVKSPVNKPLGMLHLAPRPKLNVERFPYNLAVNNMLIEKLFQFHNCSLKYNSCGFYGSKTPFRLAASWQGWQRWQRFSYPFFFLPFFFVFCSFSPPLFLNFLKLKNV